MHKMRKIICVLFSFIMLISCAVPAYAKENSSQRTVRIGYFDNYGYHNMEQDGSRSGYGYEFYQMMLRYCNWNYEYIGFEQTWSGIMEMLDQGKVDVVTLANKTPEREEKYLYSDNPIGSVSSVITVDADNTEIVPGNYETNDGRTE